MMNLLVTLTTFLLIVTTQLLMIHAQGFKENEYKKLSPLNDAVRMGEFLARHKLDADKINSQYQRPLYRHLLRSRRGLDIVLGGTGKTLDTDISKVGNGLDTTLGHLTDSLEDILGSNEPESNTGGLLGLGFLIHGLSKFLGGTLHKVSHNLLHNALQDTSHLTHALLNPDENGNIGGSIGFHGSVGGRFDPALQYYLLHHGYYNS